MQQPCQARGFSLVEFLVAVVILSFGILSVITMQTTALNIQSRNKMSAQVQFVGQEVIERLVNAAVDDNYILSYNGIDTSNAATKPATSGDNPAPADFDYFKTLAAQLAGKVTISVGSTKPYPATVQVYWTEGAAAAGRSHRLSFSTYLIPH